MFSTEQPQMSIVGPNSTRAEILNMDITLKANATITAGAVVSISAFSLYNTSPSTTNEGVSGYVASTGTNNAALSVLADTNNETRKILAVALTGATSGNTFKARVRGVCLIQTTAHTSVNYGGGTFTTGATAGKLDLLNPTAGNTATQIAVAIPLEATVNAGTTTFLFDGINGFGGSGV